MDTFFDCLNARSYSKHVRQRKPNVRPYTSVDDVRFNWLTNDFLGYLKRWKEYTDKWDGNFTLGDCQKMFLSAQTYGGL